MPTRNPLTPSQTVGPFFRIGLDPLAIDDLGGGVGERRITVQGTVYDGDGKPVPDALIETWQADGGGRYADVRESTSPSSPPARGSPAFRGFGRVATDDAGHFTLRTIIPGPTNGPGGAMQAPHLAVAIFMRGLLKQLNTRIYFAGDPTIAADPIMALVPASRRKTLCAHPRPGAGDEFHWDVRLQGPDETVFFDI